MDFVFYSVAGPRTRRFVVSGRVVADASRIAVLTQMVVVLVPLCEAGALGTFKDGQFGCFSYVKYERNDVRALVSGEQLAGDPLRQQFAAGVELGATGVGDEYLILVPNGKG